MSIWQELSPSSCDPRWEPLQFPCLLWCRTLPVLTASILIFGIYLWPLGIWCTMKNRNPPLPSKKKKERKKPQLFNRILFCSLPWQVASALYPGSSDPQRTFLRTFLRTDLGSGWRRLWNDINEDAKMPNGAPFGSVLKGFHNVHPQAC